MTIDWSKPIELVDGTPAVYQEVRKFDSEFYVCVNGYIRIYDKNGKHVIGELPNVCNKIEKSIEDMTDQELADTYREGREKCRTFAFEIRNRGYIIDYYDALGVLVHDTDRVLNADPTISIDKTIVTKVEL